MRTRLIRRESWPVRCGCPTNSSNLCGRRRSASGAAAVSLLVFVRFGAPASATVVLGAARFVSTNEDGVAATWDVLGVFGTAPVLNMDATGDDACLDLGSFALAETRSEGTREELLSEQLLSRCALMSRSATVREHTGLQRASSAEPWRGGACGTCHVTRRKRWVRETYEKELSYL